MFKLAIPPDGDSYQATDGEASIYVALQGGAGRSRLDKIGSAKRLSVSWTMNPVQYQYWRAFYMTATKEASLPFLCDLVSEDGTGPVEHQCQFIPGSISMPRQVGLTYIQQAQMEALPLPRNESDDISIIIAFQSSDGDPLGWYNALEHLANVTIPEAEAFDA